MREELDAIIIGGGPAGSAFAFSAARAGKRVALFEKDVVPGRKVCGGVLSPKCWRILQKLGMEDAVADLPFQKLQYLQAEVENGTKLKIQFPESELPSRVIDRSLFDASLWKFAQKHGALMHDQSAAFEIQNESGVWKVKTSGKSAGIFSSRMLIGADGRNSFVARQMGLKATRLKRTVCYQYQLRSHEFSKDGVHFFIFRDGYCGLSVDGSGYAHLDILSLKGGENDVEIMGRLLGCKSEFVDKLKAAAFFEGKPLARSPIGGGSRPFPSQENVFLLGDAQKWYEPFTGEGIRLALESSLNFFRLEGSSRRRSLPAISKTNWWISQILRSPLIAKPFIQVLSHFPSLSRMMARDVLG